jgi:hypothetical protein
VGAPRSRSRSRCSPSAFSCKASTSRSPRPT